MAGEIGCWPFHGWCDILKTMNLLLDMLLAASLSVPFPPTQIYSPISGVCGRVNWCQRTEFVTPFYPLRNEIVYVIYTEAISMNVFLLHLNAEKVHYSFCGPFIILIKFCCVLFFCCAKETSADIKYCEVWYNMLAD